MNTPSPESAHRLGLTALLVTAFALPLAFLTNTYDSTAIKFTLLQWGALTMAFAWLWQGVSRGRFQVSVSSWSVLLPALAYGAWMIVRLATAPHALASFPGFLSQLIMLVSFLAAFLEFSGARSASRFALLTVSSCAIVCLYGLAQALGLDPLLWKGAFGSGPLGARVFSTLGNPPLCASFIAVAVPVALTFALDPDTPRPLRLGALITAPLAVFVAILTGSAPGMAAVAVSCLPYALILPSTLRTRAALKSAGLALLLATIAGAASFTLEARGRQTWSYTNRFRAAMVGAELRMLAERPLVGLGPGSFSVHFPRFRPADIIRLQGAHSSLVETPELPALGVAVELGAVGAALWLWMFAAALSVGARGARALRRAGATAESVYAAGFTAAAAGGLAASHLVFSQSPGAQGWLLWPLAGMASGLAPLACRRAAVSVYPLPISEDIRRALYAPGLLGLAALTIIPGLWLRSQVDLNTAIYYAKTGRYDEALSRLERAYPGSPNYCLSIYFRGNVLAAQNKHKEALAAYELLQTHAPDFILVHALKGRSHALLGDWTAAADERARQARLDPLDMANLVAWSEAARAAGRLDQARAAAAQAEALDADDPRVRLQIAANNLIERRLATQDQRRRHNGRNVAKKPR
ncbi:MAG: O-antigen ligase family protein [Elusimicrobiota bacterium]